MIPRSRDFRLLWLGQGTSQLGNRAHQLAVAWWVLQTTGSSAQMGLVLAASSLPMVLGGPIAGALADRMDRRLMMRWADGLGALIVAFMAVLAYVGALGFPVLLLLTATLGVLTAALTPAVLATVPEVVDPTELVVANSLQEAVTQGAGLVGPALGGVLVATLGAPAAFALNALSYAVSTAALLGLGRRPHSDTSAAESFLATLRGGVDTVRTRPEIAQLLALFGLSNLVFAALPVLLPLFAKDAFQAGAPGLGLLEGSLGAGLIAGSLGMARLGTPRARVHFIAACYATQALAMGVAGARPGLASFSVALAIVGAALGGINGVALATFQSRVPPERMGRFMGLLMAIVMGAMPLAFVGVGMLAQRVALSTLWISGACGLGATALLLLMLPALKALQEPLEVEPA